MMRKLTPFRDFFQHHNDSNITAEIQIVRAHISCFQFVSVLPFFIPNWLHDKFSHPSHTEKKQVQEAKLLWEGVVKNVSMVQYPGGRTRPHFSEQDGGGGELLSNPRPHRPDPPGFPYYSKSCRFQNPGVVSPLVSGTSATTR